MTAPRAETRDVVVLALAGITKRFGTTTAVDDVSLDIRRGTIHALLGENGAGKTTLMRVAFGLVAADAGRVMAKQHQLHSAVDAIAAGLGMVHQHFTNVPAMTVAENVALGGHGRFDRATAARQVEDIGARSGLRLDPDARAEDLPVGAQQRLEIVKALARNADVLILDEPTAVLAPREIDELLQWLRGFAAGGNAVVLITHKLKEALAVADDVTVLRRGKIAWSGVAIDATVESISAAMLGGEPTERPPMPVPATPISIAEAVAEASGVTIADERGVTAVRDASLAIHAGEIIGVAGVEGAGQRQLLRALAGRARIASGSLRLPEVVGFVPEDRHRDALVLDFTAAENMALKQAGRRRGRFDWRAVRERTRSLVSRFDVRGVSERGAVRTLSGGNQQKLVLARELDGRPAMIVVENPTRGLDVRATQDVHDRLRAVAAAGAAVVLYSSDLDEVLSLATRVVVVHAGEVRECPRDRDTVGRAMLGVA